MYFRHEELQILEPHLARLHYVTFVGDEGYETTEDPRDFFLSISCVRFQLDNILPRRYGRQTYPAIILIDEVITASFFE